MNTANKLPGRIFYKQVYYALHIIRVDHTWHIYYQRISTEDKLFVSKHNKFEIAVNEMTNTLTANKQDLWPW